MTKVNQKVLDKIVRRIVKVAKPEKIIMFGSAARGEMGPNSDVDLLIIKSRVHRRKLAMKIYRHLGDVGCAVDVVVVRPQDVKRYGKCPALVIEPALRDGKLLYAA